MTLPGAQWLTPIEGGWRVRTTATCHVDILCMAFGNLRVVLTDLGETGYRRGWCYQRPLLEVVALARAFDPDAEEEPLGWVKEAGTERRACAWHFPAGEHPTYDPSCSRCGK
jgi:hypothetical protein